MKTQHINKKNTLKNQKIPSEKSIAQLSQHKNGKNTLELKNTLWKIYSYIKSDKETKV